MMRRLPLSAVEAIGQFDRALYLAGICGAGGATGFRPAVLPGIVLALLGEWKRAKDRLSRC